MFVDGLDVVFGRGESYIFEAFKTFNSKIVVSAETNCAPHGFHGPRYPYTGSPYKYLNSGCYMGETYALTELMWELDLRRLPDTVNDQGLLAEWWLRHKHRAALDYDAEIFQSLYHAEHHIRDEGNSIRNVLTDTYPAVFHGNGSADMSKLLRLSQ